ncbi:MAG: hypothetical protein U0R23_05990 [Candidatus Nanopelagicales bacterium]
MLIGGLVVAAAAALAGNPLLTAAGLLVYLGGFLAVAAPHPRGGPAQGACRLQHRVTLAAVAWFTGSLLLMAAAIATSSDWAQALARAGRFTVPVLVGFAHRSWAGALAYLVPVVLGGGPSPVRRTTAIMGRAGWARLVATNLGLVLWLLPVPSPSRSSSPS